MHPIVMVLYVFKYSRASKYFLFDKKKKKKP